MKNDKQPKDNKRKIISIIIVCMLLFLFLPSLLKSHENISKTENKIINSADGFLSANSVDESQFIIDGSDDKYGPFIINTTKNKYLAIKLIDGDSQKNIGYIELDDNLKYYAIWENKDVSFLCIKTMDRWYFFDEKGNLIEQNNTIIKEVENAEKSVKKASENIEQNQKEEINKESIDNISNFVYKSAQTYNGFNIGVTYDNEIVLYKIENNTNKYKIYYKTKSYISEDKLKDNDYVRENGPGFYADYNNGNSGNIRLRVDRYNNKLTGWSSQTWNEINGTTGELISSVEYTY